MPPVSAGAWRLVETSASAPKASAERRIARTLCGSVTWSSTTTSGPTGERVDRQRLERQNLDGDALVNRVAAEQAVEDARLRLLGATGELGAGLGEAGEGVGRADHPAHGAARIGERGDRGVDAIDEVLLLPALGGATAAVHAAVGAGRPVPGSWPRL